MHILYYIIYFIYIFIIFINLLCIYIEFGKMKVGNNFPVSANICLKFFSAIPGRGRK